MTNQQDQKQPRRTRKLAIGVAGGAVLIVGIIAIPYPGPGWLIVFIGLGILAQEFPWAGRALVYFRTKYEQWTNWVKRQNALVKSLTFIGTTIIVVITIWLLNGYGLLNSWFNLGLDWLRSPLIS